MTKEHIQQSIDNALIGKSNLTDSELSIRGFSTATMRHLFNNLCSIKKGNYLEIGLYCGATFCSSFNKDTISVGIENFSQDFGINTVELELKGNMSKFLPNAKAVKIIDADCFSENAVDHKHKFDIYFFDGEHSEESQAKSLPHFIDKMNDTFAYIVDDTNWSQVSAGTKRGIQSLGDAIEIVYEWNLVGSKMNDDPIWHNGVKIFLINKKQK